MAIMEIVRIAEKVLEAIGRDCPEGFTDSFAEELSKQMGGDRPYFASKESREARNREIRKRFNGRNIRQLCEIYDLSRQSIYRILNTEKL